MQFGRLVQTPKFWNNLLPPCTLKSTVLLWYDTVMVDRYQHFREICCIHHLGDGGSRFLQGIGTYLPNSDVTSSRKLYSSEYVEAVCSSITSVSMYQTVWHHIPEDCSLLSKWLVLEPLTCSDFKMCSWSIQLLRGLIKFDIPSGSCFNIFHRFEHCYQFCLTWSNPISVLVHHLVVSTEECFGNSLFHSSGGKVERYPFMWVC
jgi:hypothetical protein